MTPPKQHRDVTETSPRHPRDISKALRKQNGDITVTPRDITQATQNQNRHITETRPDTTESMNFSILKHHPSTYGPQLHWFAQRCTIYKFKLELWIWLRNPIKMFINVHHQKIKTPSPKQKKTALQHQRHNSKPSPTHHQNITEPSPHITETSPIHARDGTNTSLKDHQKTTKKPTKQHQNNTDTSPKKDRDRDTTET